MKLRTDGDFLGIISMTVRLSTNFAVGDHNKTRSFPLTAKSNGLIFVPLGIPPSKERGDKVADDWYKLLVSYSF